MTQSYSQHSLHFGLSTNSFFFSLILFPFLALSLFSDPPDTMDEMKIEPDLCNPMLSENLDVNLHEKLFSIEEERDAAIAEV